MAQRRKRKAAWSYIAGTKGVNRVRAYQDGDGRLYLDWQETVFDSSGAVVINTATGKPLKRRQRMSLSAEGVESFTDAIKKAEEVAEKFSELGSGSAAVSQKFNGPVTLGDLMNLYLREVVPFKKVGTQRQDRLHARVLLAFFGKKAVVERIGVNGLPQTEIGLKRYNAYLRARAAGEIPGFPRKVKEQSQLNDVRFMHAVFNWARVERDDGTFLLLRNPWHGFKLPKVDNPARPVMTPELLQQFVGAGNWRLGAVLEICLETRRRGGSVRQLALSDIDLESRTVRWQGEKDKAGRTSVTPLTSRAVGAILRALEMRRSEGVESSPWLFPAPRDASVPLSAHTLRYYMQATRKRLGVEIPRFGVHATKRAGVRDPRFRALPPSVQAALSGTTYGTLERVYQFVGVDDMRDALKVLEADEAPLPYPQEPRRLRKAA